MILSLEYFIKNSISIEYFYFFLSLVLSIIIALILYFAVSFLSYKQYNIEKVSSYECGFHPFEDAREKFNVRFYLVSILFIIFDLEITFLFPWSVTLRYIDFFGFWVMIIFLVILTIGFIYEWLKGALEWE